MVTLNENRVRVVRLSDIATLIAASARLIQNLDERALLLLAARHALDTAVAEVRHELEADPEDLRLRGEVRFAIAAMRSLDETLRSFERETETELRRRAMRALADRPPSACEQRTAVTGAEPWQVPCGSPVSHTFVWPGRRRSGICRDHVPKLLSFAKSLGLSAEDLDLVELGGLS